MARVSITTPTFIVVLVLTGCQGPTTQKTVAVAAPKQVAVGPNVGSVAPNIDGEDTNGQRMALADHKGQVVVLNFWANW